MPWNQAPAVTLEYILASFLPAGWVYPSNEDLSRVLPLGDKLAEAMLEFGYMHLQATKPDTVGVGLNRRETLPRSKIYLKNYVFFHVQFNGHFTRFQ